MAMHWLSLPVSLQWVRHLVWMVKALSIFGLLRALLLLNLHQGLHKILASEHGRVRASWRMVDPTGSALLLPCVAGFWLLVPQEAHIATAQDKGRCICICCQMRGEFGDQNV